MGDFWLKIIEFKEHGHIVFKSGSKIIDTNAFLFIKEKRKIDGKDIIHKICLDELDGSHDEVLKRLQEMKKYPEIKNTDTQRITKYKMWR